MSNFKEKILQKAKTNSTPAQERLVGTFGATQLNVVEQKGVNLAAQIRDELSMHITMISGAPGLSAYQIWLSQGYIGTEMDFLEWLQGDIQAHNMDPDAHPAFDFIKGVEYIPTTHKIEFTFRDDTKYEIDLPLEQLIKGLSYDSTTQELVLTLEDGSQTRVPLGDIVEDMAMMTWVEDNYLKKVTNNTETIVYAAEAGGVQRTYPVVSHEATINSIPRRTATGQIKMIDGIESNDGATVGQTIQKIQPNLDMGKIFRDTVTLPTTTSKNVDVIIEYPDGWNWGFVEVEIWKNFITTGNMGYIKRSWLVNRGPTYTYSYSEINTIIQGSLIDSVYVEDIQRNSNTQDLISINSKIELVNNYGIIIRLVSLDTPNVNIFAVAGGRQYLDTRTNVNTFAKDNEVVKLTGNQRINGIKEFEDALHLLNSGVSFGTGSSFYFANKSSPSATGIVGFTHHEGNKIFYSKDLTKTHGNEIATVDQVDSKLDKVTAASTLSQAYAKTSGGVQTMININGDVTESFSNTIPQRTAAGQIKMADGVESNDGATIGQLNDKADKTSTIAQMSNIGNASIKEKLNEWGNTRNFTFFFGSGAPDKPSWFEYGGSLITFGGNTYFKGVLAMSSDSEEFAWMRKVGNNYGSWQRFVKDSEVVNLTDDQNIDGKKKFTNDIGLAPGKWIYMGNRSPSGHIGDGAFQVRSDGTGYLWGYDVGEKRIATVDQIPDAYTKTQSDAKYATMVWSENVKYKGHIKDAREIGANENFPWTPENVPDNSVTDIFSYIPGVSGWRSVMTMKGWSGGYASWQIIGPAETHNQNDLYFRSSASNTAWNDPKKIAFTDEVVDLTDDQVIGGTKAFTGQIFSHGNFGGSNIDLIRPAGHALNPNIYFTKTGLGDGILQLTGSGKFSISSGTGTPKEIATIDQVNEKVSKSQLSWNPNTRVLNITGL